MFNWLTSASQEPKTLGQIGEELAQGEYKTRGFKILAANFFNKKGLRLGELDFVATDGHVLAFVEVKTRTGSGGKFGTGAEAVNLFKQKKMLKAVKVFLQKYPKYYYLQPRIDVCVITAQEFDKTQYSVIIIPNAVEDWI